ncbi:type IV secretion system DNA-binding domain-containing protein [bacterium]|jgi:CxxC-x17-CxxC domain-containing protein|nr:type IV secretion system DNA-binding domain-containing protein [bacterium]MBT4495638.1 type IV secretion system DNA-binding domain-containing protein [bacterium]MBT4764114.1 type IV secretion system DNA-binding domain-containing protein [bacterium]MBT5401486.1 type IV secretion system DNA-binding domain-containing protein [bacterium]MBT5942555.1 type IV secretion system DNA-binding domain-containing protein [bacterium]
MADQDITLLAQTNFRNDSVKFGMKEDDRRRHTYVLGKTGMGKTNLLESMIIQDIQAGRGVAVVDPHGELVEGILKYIPNDRINDVIYFNPADYDFPIAFNVLEQVSAEYRHLVASGLLGVFQKIWADSWGPRLEYVLNNAILALLEYPGSTLLGVMKMLVDKEYRKKVVAKITDPVVKSFWIDEYSKYPDRFQTEAIAPIQNKVGRFLSSSMMRNIVGQVKSAIDIREIMDGKKILLLNLSKGRIGEDNSALLGAMMVTKMQLAAMSRVDIPEEERNDFYLYVDEFQNFATDSFANILSEARKYRLNIIIAHQYIEQLGDIVRAAVFGNVGTIITFRIGAEDADFLVKEFTPRFDETDLVNLPKFNIYLKLMIDGVSSEPFSASTFKASDISNQPEDLDTDVLIDKIIKVTRERYATQRTVIEEKIIRWSGVNDEKPEPKKDNKFRKPNNFKNNNDSRQNNLNKVNCSSCAKETFVSFVPDGKRPVYCKDCLNKVKEQKNTPPPRIDISDKVNNMKSISLKDALNDDETVDFKNNKKVVKEDPKTLDSGNIVNFK